MARKNNLFKTSDLALATTVSLFYPIEAIDKIVGSTKIYFLFKRNKSLEQLLKKYWRQELKIEPQAYFNQLKIIKARLYANE